MLFISLFSFAAQSAATGFRVSSLPPFSEEAAFCLVFLPFCIAQSQLLVVLCSLRVQTDLHLQIMPSIGGNQQNLVSAHCTGEDACVPSKSVQILPECVQRGQIFIQDATLLTGEEIFKK